MAAVTPSTGLLLLDAYQLRSVLMMVARRAGVSGIHWPRKESNM